MKKGAKLAIIFGVGALAALLSYYFLVWKPKHPKEEKPEKTDEEKLVDWLNGGSQGTPPVVLPPINSGGGYTPPVNTVTGKKAYVGNYNGVKIIYVSDATTYRVKNKGEYVGVVVGEATLGGTKFYTIGDGKLAVAKNLVTLS